MPIGVFDSGIGGLSVLNALREELPNEDFVYLADSGFAPYGERGDAFVTARTLAITQYLHVQHHVKALVIACNTATAAAVHKVRSQYPSLPVVGVEPALKPAVGLSKTGHIGVIATRGTVESLKFQTLMAGLQGQANFSAQACDGLAAAIEHHALYPGTENAAKIIAMCAVFIAEMGKFGHKQGQIDTVVLGCTHYVFATAALREVLGEDIQLIDNGPAVARQTRRLLSGSATPALRATGPFAGHVKLLSTGAPETLHSAAAHWLGLQEDARPQTVDVPHHNPE